MDPLTRVIPNPVVVLREEFDDWALLYNPDTGDALGLNPTAVLVWEQLQGLTAGEVVNAVTAGFAEVPVDASEEVLCLLDRLVNEGYASAEDA